MILEILKEYFGNINFIFHQEKMLEIQIPTE